MFLVFVYLLVPNKIWNLIFFRFQKQMLCKCLSGLMQFNCHLQRDLTNIHNMTRLQAIVTAFKEIMTHALWPCFKYFYLFLYLYIMWITTNNNAPHLNSRKNQRRRAALGRPAIEKRGGGFNQFSVYQPSPLVLPKIIWRTYLNSLTTKSLLLLEFIIYNVSAA